jgi:glycosyltransferase involved in cell wall biosynthesis
VFFGSRIGSEPYFDERFGKTIFWTGLSLDRFSHRFLNGDATPAVSAELDATSLEQELERFQPDAILTYGYMQRLQRRAQAWAHRNDRYLFYFSDSELRQHRPLWKEGVKLIVIRRILQAIDWFIVTGNANEEYYRRYGVKSDRMVRGSYPIDRAAYQIAFERRKDLRTAARKELGIDESDFVACMVGKLVSWKRQGDLIKAMAEVRPNAAVALIVGAGADQAELERTARKLPANRVVFSGFTPTHRLPELYAASDLYVHASEVEPHSVAISEAIYMGLPVLVSNRSGSYGMDDDVRPGVNGLVYRCGDVAALSSTISWFARNPTLSLSMGRESHEIARRQQGVVYDKLLSTFSLLLDAVPRRRRKTAAALEI